MLDKLVAALVSPLGTALVLEAIFLPLGSMHTLMGPGRISLELIEVQVGYLNEDDIVRFEDLYGRA